MFFNILDNKRLKILDELNSIDIIKNFALGGGTALSLQMGLRESFDFDFFTANHFNIFELETLLKSFFNERLEILNKYENRSSLDAIIDGVKISFFEYEYKQIGDVIILEKYKNIKLLDYVDILCMKVVAINQRGSKKDFFDFYQIINKYKIKPGDLIHLLNEKYSDPHLLNNFTISLMYFDDAENEILPHSFIKYDWGEIKLFCVNYSKEFTKLINKPLYRD